VRATQSDLRHDADLRQSNFAAVMFNESPDDGGYPLVRRRQPCRSRIDCSTICAIGLLRGESGAISISLGALTRLRSNPFWSLIDRQIGTLVDADLARAR
jgi:hypothetical protein